MAKRRLPRAVFDYIDGGADGEVTLRENARVFDDVVFTPRNAVTHNTYDLHTTVLGQQIDLPFMLAPVGFSRSFFPRGECFAAQEAGRAGTGYILSTVSGCRLEDVRASTGGLAWYQLYLCGGKDVASAGIERAHAAGYGALVVTIDTPVSGMRERDVRNGMKALAGGRFTEMLPYLPHVINHPGWLIDFLRDGGVIDFPNVMLADGPMKGADVGAALEQSAVTWSDFRWLRQIWNGPIVVKGVLSVEDARRAVEEGAQAIVVSNHGGRQLDTVSSTLAALPAIVDAVGAQTEVLFDGGIRRGSDVVKALAFGARAVLIGRAYAYGLGACGAPGVARAIQILRADILRTLKLLGCAAVTDLDRSFIKL